MRVSLSGGAYRAHSLVAAAQRQVNLFSEPVPGNLTEPAPVALYPAPGTTHLVTLPQAPVRGLHRATNGTLYAVAGSGVYAVSSAWGASLLGSITGGLTTPVSMADNGLQMVIVDGSANGWTVTLASNAFAPIVDPTGSFRGGMRVDYLDTFFLFAVPNTPQFQVSNSLATTFDPLYFANKAAFSDLLVSLIVAKREIWLIGSETTEVWYNTGGADFPFSSMPGVFIDRGCCAPYSVAEIDNAVFWLSQDRYGQGIVLQGAGYEATRVSTYAIEAEMANYATLTDAIGYTYQLAGHVFYVLSFPSSDKTWCYDLTTKLWHELVWLDANGTEHRHRGVCGCAAYGGTVVVGDWQSGALYELDPAVYTDDGQPILRLRSFPHLEADGKRVFFRQFIADLEAGNQPAASAEIIVPGTIPDSRQIAELIVPVDGFGTPTYAITDWTRGRIYLWRTFSASIRIYTTAMTTQSPVLSGALTGTSSIVYGGDVDPITGDLIIQDGSGLNASPIHKYDATDLSLLGTFGISTSYPSFPTSVWAGQALVCLAVNGVGYALLKESEFSGAVAVIRTDTMANAGFYSTVVTGSTDDRGLICRGASGGTRGSVFLTWEGVVDGQKATIPLYTVVITAGAESYNPATWPTRNSHITSSAVGTIAATAVDPAWTTLQANTIGYDATDGNVLMEVTTTNSVPHTRYIIKVNATSAAVMWAVAMGNTRGVTQLAQYNVGYGYAAFVPSGLRDVITTGTAALNSAAMAGIVPSSNGLLAGDDVSGLVLLRTAYVSGGTAPTAVSGTPSSFTGWALIAGIYPSSPTTIPVSALDPQIYLSWSDDGGRHFGNPVGISMGRAGAYLTSLQWQRLGMGRRRIFQLEWSVPVKTALLGAWIDSTPAQS